MAEPSDLVTHYSTKAFQTRLAALTFVGAVLGADVVWKNELIRSDTLGIGLLLVVGSLAELNRRYTYSYLCACVASARSDVTKQWWNFTKKNEALWSLTVPKSEGWRRWKIVAKWVSRFLLSWGTYLPGIVAGAYLAWPQFAPNGFRESIARPAVAAFLVIVLLLWWGFQTSRPAELALVDGEEQPLASEITAERGASKTSQTQTSI